MLFAGICLLSSVAAIITWFTSRTKDITSISPDIFCAPRNYVKYQSNTKCAPRCQSAPRNCPVEYGQCTFLSICQYPMNRWVGTSIVWYPFKLKCLYRFKMYLCKCISNSIGAFMFTNTWRHFHTCAVHWLAEEPQPPAFTCKTCAMSEPKRWNTGLNTHIFQILLWGKTYVDSSDRLSHLCYVKKKRQDELSRKPVFSKLLTQHGPTSVTKYWFILDYKK